MSKEVMAELMKAISEENARDVIAHRKGLKCPLTIGGARRLVKEYLKTGNPNDAAEEHLNRGWQGFKAEWVQNSTRARFADQRNPSPVQSANYGRPEPETAPKPISEDEKRRRAEQAARASAIVRGVANGLKVH